MAEPLDFYFRVNPNLSEKKKSFIEQIFPHAQDASEEYGVPTSVILAMAAHESNWGQSQPTDVYSGTKSYNLFGIKGEGTAGAVKSWTWEVVNGQKQKTVADFRAYESIRESVMDFARLLSTSDRYQPAFQTKNPFDFVEKVHESGYATDPNYSEKVKRVIESNYLTLLDAEDFNQKVKDTAKNIGDNLKDSFNKGLEKVLDIGSDTVLVIVGIVLLVLTLYSMFLKDYNPLGIVKNLNTKGGESS